MKIAKKSVKFSFDFSNAQITPMTINGCGGYNLENITIPLVGYTLSMDGDTFDGQCVGEISFNYLDIDDILEKLEIVGTDSYFDQEYERISQRILQEGRQRYGDYFDEYEDTDRSELINFELNYPALTQRMWDNLKLDIKSAKLSKFTFTGKWSSWDDSPDIDEWKEGIKGSLTVDITDADGNTYRDVKVKFDDSTSFIFGEEALDYMESAVYTANERDDGYMANTKKSRPIKKEYDYDYFVSRLASDLKQRLDRDAGIIVRDVVPRDGGYDITLDFYTNDKSIVDLGYYLGKYFKRVIPIGSSTYHCVDEMISEGDWYRDTPVSKTKMLSKNDKVKSMNKNRIAKNEWEGNDYSPIASEKDIERALAQEYSSRFDGLVKLQYVGTDWAMGSQYWVALFKCKNVYEDYACVTVLDWTRYEPNRGIETLGYTYGTLEEMEDAFYEKVIRESRGTRKSMMKSKGDKMKKYNEFVSYLGETWDYVSNAFNTLDDMCRSGHCPQRFFSQVDNLAGLLNDIMLALQNIVDEYEYTEPFSKSAKESKREILKAKVNEILEEGDEEEDEEDDDEIAKPRMKDMFLDSKRKSCKSTKSNDEKGEDADEYREESDGDDVSDSKVMKPEGANDNEDENEAPSGGNSSLSEDADGQENQSTKREKRMSKFSVTAGGSQPYNGRENYNQSPMMREAIDRFKAEKDLVKSLQDRVDEINSARKNTNINNKSPLRIKGRN